jgi:two-component system phosphate regulon sensor histidine kinase PhoR
MSFNWFAFRGPPYLEFRLSPAGLLVTVLYAGLLAWIVWRDRGTFRSFERHQWWGFAALLISAPLLAGTLFLRFSTAGGSLILPLLGFLPLLASALWLGAAPAALTGLLAGLTWALFETGRLTQPFEVALLCGVFGLALQQPFRSRLSQWLRMPVIAAPAGALFAGWPLQIIAILVTGLDTPLNNLAQALALALPALAVYLVCAVIAGVTLQLILARWPALHPIGEADLIPAPWEQHLQSRILYSIVPFAILFVVLLAAVVAVTAYTVATRMVPPDMGSSALLAIALPPLVMVLLAAAAVIPLVVALSRQVVVPLEKLAQAADEMARGRLDQPLGISGEDEVGRLGRAFEVTRISLGERLDELERLLSVSRSVASSLELFRSIPPILNSALDVAHAGGVRIVLRGRGGQPPQVYAAGEHAAVMAVLDGQLLDLVEKQGTLVISRLWRASGSLDLSNLPPDDSLEALVALPLRSETSFHGILWLGYDQEHLFEQSELTFLSTLAGQAAIAVANAQLFTEAAEGRRKLETVLESTADGMIATDNQGRIVLLNPAAEKIFDVRAEQVVNRMAVDVIENPHLAVSLTNLQEPAVMLEMPHRGGLIYAANTSTMVSHDGVILGRVAVLRDITALKELDNIKTVFLRMVSHDLRSPLTYMRGYASMLPLSGGLNERQVEALDRISEGIKHIEQMTERLTYLSRLQFGESAELEFTLVDVEELLQEEVSRYTELARQKNVAFEMDVEAKLPLLLCDGLLYAHAVTNLLQNALKYTPEGGHIRVQACQNDDGQSITVSVIDNGRGIREEDQLHLFEAFYRVPQREGDPPRPRGSGLGLALVRAIADAHNGTIGVESVFGKGSRFHITLPLRHPGEL